MLSLTDIEPAGFAAQLHYTSLYWNMQARQKWHITADKGFASSSNARNELMLRDAGEFAGHIKRCEKDIRILKNATEGQAF